MFDVEVALSEYFAGNDNDSGVLQWAGGWQALSWSGKDIRIILEDDAGMIQGDTACIIIYNASFFYSVKAINHRNGIALDTV